MFYVNALLILPALALGWWGIPASPPRGSSHPFDLSGAMLLPVGLIGITGLLTHGPTGDPMLALMLCVVLAVLAAVLLRRELSHPDPVLQPRLFGCRDFAAANAGIALSNLAMYSTLLATPILLLRRTGWTSAEAGLVLAVMSLGMVVFSPVGGRLADRLGRRGPTVAGLSLLLLGLVPLALGGGAITTRALLAGLALIGVGIGLSSAGLQTAALEAVGAQDAGAASGLFATSRYLGSIVGSGALAGFLGPTRDGAAGFAGVFLMAGGAAFLSVLAVSTLGRSRG
jgi:predicted MFS family arabinose efflux permease